MSEWLPSLNAVRAFEAVCRHLNFAHAAEELRVTPAAVKQLVRKLEEALGTQLVLRSGRGLALTPAGRAGFAGLSSGFMQIEKAVDRMRSQAGRRRLIVSVEPSFATGWLVPKLGRFRKYNSGIDVLIDSSLEIVNLEKGEADIAIRFGSEPSKALVAQRLVDERLCALCSPTLTVGERALRQISDLARATLIHWDTSDLTWASTTRKWMGWQQWLEMVGANQINSQGGVLFNDYNLAVQAAIAGQGVVLGSMPILHDVIEAKLLVNPFKETVATNIGYDVVATVQALRQPEVKSFAEWIIAEAGRTSARA